MVASIEPALWTLQDDGTAQATDVLTTCCNAHPVNKGGEKYGPICPECGNDQPEFKAAKGGQA